MKIPDIGPAWDSAVIEDRQSDRLVHTELAHADVSGEPESSSVTRATTAATTIAAIPRTIAATSQLLRTKAESNRAAEGFGA